MDDKTPTHLPAEGEGTPALPADSDLAPPQDDNGDVENDAGADAADDELPPFEPQLPAAAEQS